MKISYKWLKNFIAIEQDPQQIDQLLTGCGLEVEDIVAYNSIPGALEGIVIAEVLEKIQHPNADKLSVCKVDIGQGEIKQIVCGAPNVAAGQKVLVATIGSTVYPTNGEPFEIKKAKIRGELSEGMICAEDELSLGNSHEGILILPANFEVGKPASTYFEIYQDHTIEIGLTANRGDAASHIGVARDLKALTGLPIQMPEIKFNPGKGKNPIDIDIEHHETCYRYCGIYVQGVEVKDSPSWLKNSLLSIGLKPINHVVDISNYVMHSLGQPLHTFDADQIAGSKIRVRQAKTNELFTTLDGVERKLSGIECMIADADKNLALAGIFGGLDSGIKSTSKNIFIESAIFESGSVRKAAKVHALNTDASFRFERGVDPEITLFAAKWAASLIVEIGGGSICEATDVYPNPIAAHLVDFNPIQSNELIGQDISIERVKEILTRLDIQIIEEKAELLKLKVPAFRTDVTRAADVTEEILRIYGLNNIEMGHQIKSSVGTSPYDFNYTLKEKIANFLAAKGFAEIATNSLTKSAYFEEERLQKAVYLKNPLSNDLNIMRMDFAYSFLEAIQYNNNRKLSDVRFFEFGKTYTQKGDTNNLDNIIETKHLYLAVHSNQQAESWLKKQSPFGYYQLKNILEQLIEMSNLTKLNWEFNQSDAALKLSHNNQVLAEIKQLPTKLCKSFDVSMPVWILDLNWGLWTTLAANSKFKLNKVPVFPSVRRDLALLIDKNIQYQKLESIARKTAGKLLKTVNVFDVFEEEKIGVDKKSYALSFILQDDEKTLNDSEIESVMNKLIAAFEKETGAKLRG
jgi:phenylalanyl-tRNA synthetase beta chain